MLNLDCCILTTRYMNPASKFYIVDCHEKGKHVNQENVDESYRDFSHLPVNQEKHDGNHIAIYKMFVVSGSFWCKT